MKKENLGLFFLGTVMMVSIILLSQSLVYSQISPGQPAPLFSLLDGKGKKYDLSGLMEQPMIILYFFDAESRPSQEGILHLNQLASKYQGYDLATWAITLSSLEKVDQFLQQTKLQFPVLLDEGKVSDLYQARMILPTTCLIGPKGKILDHLQGGGKSTEKMLVRIAERQLQQKNTQLAQAISDQVIEKDPRNVKAHAVKGHAAIKEGDLTKAKEIFQNMPKENQQAEVISKEGLAAVYVKKGETERALLLIEEVKKKAPDRSYVYTLEGDILFNKNKKKEAAEKFEQAIKKKEKEPYHEAIAYNKLGRLKTIAGKYAEAREFFEQSEALDPYYIESTSNKAITYEKEGKWDKALDAYRQVLSLDKSDSFALALAKRAQEMITLQKDSERNKRLDMLVKDLAERFHKRKENSPKLEDTWTSRPMVLSFVDFQEKGCLAESGGLSTVLTTQLGEHLNASGRVQVVERALMERLLEELNLGSSDLADPETALRLGQVLAAKLVGTGSLFYLPNSTMMSLRFIDTETSAIPMAVNKQMQQQTSLEEELFALNREILKTVMEKYPLRGYLVEVMEKQAMVNLGARQGVVLGSRFTVLEEAKPISYRGKMLQKAPKPIAWVEVTKVEPDLCYVKIINQQRPLKADDKVQEMVIEVAMGETGNEVK